MKRNFFLLLLLPMMAFIACDGDEVSINSIVFTNENNVPIDTLDFGYTTDNVRTFKIKNKNSRSFYWKIIRENGTYWIVSISPESGEIPSGGEQVITVTIDKEGLQRGENTTILTVQNMASERKELPVLAIGTVPTAINGYVGVINSTSARLRGEITEAGEPAYTERGFVHSTTAMPTIENGTKLIVPNSSEAKFSADIAGLTPNKTYHARAYVISPLGIVYSEDVSFTPSNDYDYKGIYVQDGGSLAAHTHDVGEGNWDTMKCMCENSAVGGFDDWRLPTRDELLFLSEHRDDFGNFVEKGRYWSSTSFLGKEMWVVEFNDYTDANRASVPDAINRVYKARCVRSLN